MASCIPWARPSPAIIERVFSEKLAASLINPGRNAHNDTSFFDFIRENILKATPLPFNMDVTYPISVADYVQRLQAVLSGSARQQIIENAAQFDILVGFPVADSCIPLSTFSRLLYDLAEQILDLARCHQVTSATSSARSLASVDPTSTFQHASIFAWCRPFNLSASSTVFTHGLRSSIR